MLLPAHPLSVTHHALVCVFYDVPLYGACKFTDCQSRFPRASGTAKLCGVHSLFLSVCLSACQSPYSLCAALLVLSTLFSDVFFFLLSLPPPLPFNIQPYPNPSKPCRIQSLTHTPTHTYTLSLSLTLSSPSLLYRGNQFPPLRFFPALSRAESKHGPEHALQAFCFPFQPPP